VQRRSMARDTEGRTATARAPLAPLDIAERDRRLDRLWARMHDQGFAALVLTSEPNFRHVTNFRSATWITTTRPRYAILPLDCLPIAIVPAGNAIVTKASGWVDSRRCYASVAVGDLLATIFSPDDEKGRAIEFLLASERVDLTS